MVKMNQVSTISLLNLKLNNSLVLFFFKSLDETCNEKFTLLQKENTELKRKLDITRHAFEKTWTQLRTANQRKEQIEKDIRQEIYKTHNVLKNVRSNFQNVNIETNLRND